MAKLTVEELIRQREEARTKIHLREGKFQGKVIIHLGTCGIAAGAREIVSAFLNEKETRKITNVLITTSGCAGLCSREPMATVELLDGAPVKYGNLTAEKAIRIFQEHILGGKIVQEYAIGLGSERGG
jgi:NADP-reducing hydrogenase subunit HndB